MRALILSKKASNQLNALLEHLEDHWSLKVKENFIKKLDEALYQIKKYPESCPQTDFIKGLHMLVISKQTSVFYKHDPQSITILSIFDNRMNPDKRKEHLSQ